MNYRALKEDLENGSSLLFFFPELDKSSKSQLYATSDGINAYDASNGVKYYIKTSYKNTIMNPEFMPFLATTDEANIFSRKRGFGPVDSWTSEEAFPISGAVDDLTFDVTDCKKRKRPIIKEEIEFSTPDASTIRGGKKKLGKNVSPY